MPSQPEKPMLYYFHQNEIVRIMRTRQLDSIDSKLDLTPSYSDDIKTGVVIETNGCIPLVDLQIHWLKKNGIEDILVHDNCSDDVIGLKKLCNEHEVEFHTTSKKMFNNSVIGSISSQDCLYEGLKWAKNKGLDVLVKLSKSLIPCYKWVDNFKKLVKESDGLTFSSYCSKDPFPIRIECIGMNVNAWTNQYTMDHLKWTIENEFPIFAEFWIDAMAKQIDGQNFSSRNDIWKKRHHVGQLHSGYVHWNDLLGTSKTDSSDRHKDVLWHQFSKDEDYLAKLNEAFPGKYKIEDLK